MNSVTPRHCQRQSVHGASCAVGVLAVRPRDDEPSRKDSNLHSPWLCMHALIRQHGSGFGFERSVFGLGAPGLCPVKLRGHVALPGGFEPPSPVSRTSRLGLALQLVLNDELTTFPEAVKRVAWTDERLLP